MITTFTETCGCCEKPCTVTYKGLEFSNARCGCPFPRIMIRAEEHAEFVRRIKAKRSAILPPTLDEMRAEIEKTMAEYAA